MEGDPRPSPTDASPTDSQSAICGEKPRDETKVTSRAPVRIPRYYGVMDDEGADEVFIPPLPPSYLAPLLPAEGSIDAMVNNPSVTLANGASDATNPSGLDWQHGEKQLMAEHNKVDDVRARTSLTSKESTDSPFMSKDKDSTLPKDRDQSSMEGTSSLTEICYDASGRHHQDNLTGDEKSNPEPEVILSGGQETEAERDKYPKQVPSSMEDNFKDETHFDKDKTRSGDFCSPSEKNSKPTTETVVEKNTPTFSSLSVNNDDFKSCGPPELCKCNQNNTEGSTNQSQVPEIPTEVSNDDEEHVDTRSLDYNLTKYHWVRRESGTSETEVPRLPISEDSEETVTKEEPGVGSRRISTGIQQGEELLQRLQQVQLRQDVQDVAESPHAFQQVEETNARMSLPIKPEDPELYPSARAEAGDSDDDQNDNWVPTDLSPLDPHEMSPRIPFPSTQHRLSVTETAIERQILEAAQEKQNLQRAGGVFNLADDPDVLEIPFKTNISLEPVTIKVDPGQRSDWQFSERKMQKEISQEIQRELVLVNQGKIPGGYSKGEVRQIKETKLLFEAFQQDNTEGPTRHRKSPASLIKGHVYPSVLERTRSLEMFSVRSRPVSRAHSLRLSKSSLETEKSPEDLRSKSPTGGPRDKTRLLPYPKQDKHVRLCRSMDSIGTDTSDAESGNKSRQGHTMQGSPILKQNPFYKLRPALALQPEVEKDIREAKEREEELRRQRCTLYGEDRQNSEDGEQCRLTQTLEQDIRRQSRGKLERVWPPPPKKDQTKSEQIQEPKVHRAGQKAPLWQRWESGLVNGQSAKEKN